MIFHRGSYTERHRGVTKKHRGTEKKAEKNKKIIKKGCSASLFLWIPALAGMTNGYNSYFYGKMPRSM